MTMLFAWLPAAVAADDPALLGFWLILLGLWMLRQSFAPRQRLRQ